MNQDREMRKQLYIVLGLAPKEAAVYDLLLTKGETPARNIEVETGLKKNTYNLLKQLEKKHLVVKVERERRVYYQPAPPDNLKILAQEQVESARSHQAALADVLPQLKATYLASVGRPVVRFVEGVTGLKEVYQTVYNQPIPASWGCLDMEVVESVLPEYVAGELIPKRVERQSRAFAVLADNDAGRQATAQDEQQLRESVLIDPKQYPLPAEISVYGERVVLLAFRPAGMTGVMIENKEIARSLESIYQLTFDLHRENQRLKRLIGSMTEKVEG